MPLAHCLIIFWEKSVSFPIKKNQLAGWIKATLSQNLPVVWIISGLTVATDMQNAASELNIQHSRAIMCISCHICGSSLAFVLNFEQLWSRIWVSLQKNYDPVITSASWIAPCRQSDAETLQWKQSKLTSLWLGGPRCSEQSDCQTVRLYRIAPYRIILF